MVVGESVSRFRVQYDELKPETRKIFAVRFILKRHGFTGKLLNVADIGCGPAVYTIFLERFAHHYVAVDGDPKFVIMSKSLSCDGIVASAANLPFRDNSFDLVYASEVVEHLPSMVGLTECARICQKILIITLPNPYWPHYKADPTHLLRYTISSLKAHLDKSRKFRSAIRGLGIELPATQYPFSIPNWFKILSLFALFFLPLFSPTLLCLGVRSPEAKAH